MPRKPAHLELVGGKGPRQRVWEAIRRLAHANLAPFTEADIWAATDGAEKDIEMGLIHDYRMGLVRAGVLEVVTPYTSRSPATFRLAQDEGSDAPRVRKNGTRVTQGLATEQMWRTLRVRKGDINARELAAYATTPKVPVSKIAANDYLINLFQAGYLERTVEGRGMGKGGIPARYRLITNTGPRPPMVQRTDAMYDPNLGKVVWIKPINEETAIYGTR